MKTCPVCQKALTDQAKFCYFCGASLLNAEPEPVAVPADVEEEPIPAEEPAPSEPFAEAEPEPLEAPAADVQPEAVFEPAAEPEPAPVIPAPEPEPAKAAAPEPVKPITPPPAKPTPVKPVETKPETVVLATDTRSLMTTVGYIFTTILFHIPIIGLIFMIVWGCGKTKNISRKRFSLACLIMRLLGCIVVLAVTVFLLICFSGVIRSLHDAIVPILFP